MELLDEGVKKIVSHGPSLSSQLRHPKRPAQRQRDETGHWSDLLKGKGGQSVLFMNLVAKHILKNVS